MKSLNLSHSAKTFIRQTGRWLEKLKAKMFHHLSRCTGYHLEEAV